ncbi:MAG: ATP-binding protein, partial [Maribacter sp.]|nr:ATP-binding protein [Maribacter sp.]
MTETNRIEYKRELSDGLEKEVIAFLNYREGGIIYIGIDKEGNTCGLADADGDQLKIKDRLKNNIRPSALGLFDIVSEERDGNNILKIIVASGPEKPYHLKKYGMSEKGCFIRLGSAAEPMPQKMIDELFAKRTRNSISKIKAGRQDLSFSQLKIYYEESGH